MDSNFWKNYILSASSSSFSQFMSISSFRLHFFSAFSLDVSELNFRRYYVSQIDLFSSDLRINNETFDGDIIYFEDWRVFRSVKLFIQQVKYVEARDDISVGCILDFCLSGDAERWFEILSLKEIDSFKNGSLKSFYSQLMSLFDENIKVEEARIAKEKAEAFACRRCPAKFSSNIKLHEHVRTKHAKKFSVATSSTSSISPSSVTSSTTSTTTSRKPISWAEIASRPKLSFTTPSRLSRLTIKFGLSTSSPSSVLLHQKSVNSMTNRFFITRFKTSYLTVQNLYIRFHDKFRPLSLIIIQNSLSSASPSGMRIRQTRITSYFKSAVNKSTNQIKLASNRKHADLKVFVKSTWIGHLASSNSYDSHFIKSLHICRRCTQQFISENMLHRHLCHCSRCTQRWLNADILTGGRHPCRSFISRY